MFQIESLENLFEDVQMASVFSDSKTFVDMIPKDDPQKIVEKYKILGNTGNLQNFVETHFDKIPNPTNDFESDTSRSVSEHIEILWNYLERNPAKNHTTSSLIRLPYPYIIPGGRFQEVYYWDSYFTLLGLAVSEKYDLIENIINNFTYLIDKLGFIPNGNRTYYLGRSQPPFFTMMVSVLADKRGDVIWEKYLPSIEKEYLFFMLGEKELSKDQNVKNRLVLMENDIVLNRYWDNLDTPRPEAYKEDVETAASSHKPKNEIYRHLRAGAESGWDFSTRWFEDEQNLDTIHTTDIIPIDLNTLLYDIENRLAKIYQQMNDVAKASYYAQKAEKRKQGINNYCWNEENGFYFDFDFKKKQQKNVFSLASIYPLFFGLASQSQADKIAKIIQKEFLQVGGFLTTLNQSGQQWDSPNAWAPLQWLTYQGLKNYGFHEIAEKGKQNWLKNCEIYYQQTGKMMEKYNAFEIGITAKGGEYPNQDGFGWTNGVYLAMSKQ